MATTLGPDNTLALVWCGRLPMFTPIAAQEGVWLLGRDTAGFEDDRVSRRHCEVTRSEAGWVFTDLGSANGTYVDGERVRGTMVRAHWDVLQVGRSLVVPVDAAASGMRVVEVEGGFVGPGLLPAWTATEAASKTGAHAMLIGARGVGIEMLARHYVRSRGRTDERFSVVVSPGDLPGSAAAELPAGVVFVAGLRDLRSWHDTAWMKTALGREDLRVCVGIELRRRRWGGPGVAVPPGVTRIDVPPLSARPEEIPPRVERMIHRMQPDLDIDVTLIEMGILYDWPGGLPELERACNEAVVVTAGANKPKVTARELRGFRAEQDALETVWGQASEFPFTKGPVFARRTASRWLRDPAALAFMIDTVGGDLDRAAQAIGVRREAVDEWVRRHGLERDA